MRFTTRDLLWLTVVAALAGAWFWDHRNEEQRHQKLRNLWSDALDQTVDSNTNVRIYRRFSELYWSQPENAAEYRDLTRGVDPPDLSKSTKR